MADDSLADLEASRPTPVPDDPKDAERLADQYFVLQFMDDETVLYALELDDFQVTLYPDQSRLSITLSGQQLSDIRDHIALRDRIILGEDARIVRLTQERDDAIRRADALEAENAHLRTQAGLPPIKTPWEQAMRETIDGQGLSMTAMGKELREKDEKIKTLEAEVGRLQQQLVRMTDRWHAAVEMGVEADKTISALSAPPAADHTELARELYCSLVFTMSDEAEDTKKIAEVLAAAGRAGAEKMRERCAQIALSERGQIAGCPERDDLCGDLATQYRALPLPGEE